MPNRDLYVAIHPQGKHLELRAEGLAPQWVPMRVASEEMAELRSVFRAQLELSRRDYARTGDAWAFLLALLSLGRGLGITLFGPSGINSIQGYFSEAYSWKCPTTANTYREGVWPAPTLEFSAGLDWFFPLELMPLFDLSLPKATAEEHREAILELAQRFPGFSMLCQRVYTLPRPLGQLVQHKTTRIHFAHHTELQGAIHETRFLDQFRGVRKLRPWPKGTRLRHQEAVRRLAKQLCDESVHIVHLSCHGNTDDTDAGSCEGTFLTIGEEDKIEFEVTLGDLRRTLATRRPAKDKKRPLVFLNLCGGSYLHRAGGDSFPKLFWENGNAAVIGAETKVFDWHASEMSLLFYHYLHEGNSIARSLQLAKWRLLEHDSNPLGLLYVLYGDGRLKLAHQTSWVYPQATP